MPSIRVEIFKNMKSEPWFPHTESDSSSSDSYNDNEGSGTQDRQDMQAHLPVFPPWFPMQALPVHTYWSFRERLVKSESVDRPCMKKIIDSVHHRESKLEPFSGCDSLLCDRVDKYVNQ